MAGGALAWLSSLFDTKPNTHAWDNTEPERPKLTLIKPTEAERGVLQRTKTCIASLKKFEQELNALILTAADELSHIRQGAISDSEESEVQITFEHVEEEYKLLESDLLDELTRADDLLKILPGWISRLPTPEQQQATLERKRLLMQVRTTNNRKDVLTNQRDRLYSRTQRALH